MYSIGLVLVGHGRHVLLHRPCRRFSVKEPSKYFRVEQAEIHISSTFHLYFCIHCILHFIALLFSSFLYLLPLSSSPSRASVLSSLMALASLFASRAPAPKAQRFVSTSSSTRRIPRASTPRPQRRSRTWSTSHSLWYALSTSLAERCPRLSHKPRNGRVKIPVFIYKCDGNQLCIIYCVDSLNTKLYWLLPGGYSYHNPTRKSRSS